MANFTLDLSISKAPKITAIVYARVGDSQGIKADVSMVDIDGQPFNLTGAKITFQGMNGKNQFVADSAGVVTTGYDLSKGKFGYVFPPSAFGVEGKYKLAYFSFLMPTTNATISSGNIDIIVYDWADVTAPEAEEALNNYNELVKELQELQKQHIDEINADFDEVNARMVKLNQDITDALAKFEAGNFYTKTQSDAKYMFKNGLAMGADDWNNYLEIGTYGVTNGTGANAPIDSVGTLLVQGYGSGGSGRTQLFINSNSIRYRQYQGGGNWTTWQVLSNLGNTDGKYMNIVSTPVKTQDWNTLGTMGTYSVDGATGLNRPSENDTWGTLLVQGKVHNDSMLTQLFISSASMYFRRKATATTWGPWRKVGENIEGVGLQLIKELDNSTSVISDKWTTTTASSNISTYQALAASLPLKTASGWSATPADASTKVRVKDGVTYDITTSVNNQAPFLRTDINLIGAILEHKGNTFFTDMGLTTVAQQVNYIVNNIPLDINVTASAHGDEGDGYSLWAWNYSTNAWGNRVLPAGTSGLQDAKMSFDAKKAAWSNYVDPASGVLSVVHFGSVNVGTSNTAYLKTDYIAFDLMTSTTLTEELKKRIGGADPIPPATVSEINAGTDNTKMVTPSGLQGSKYNKSTVFGAWTNIPLNTGYKAADSTVPKYRIIEYMQSDGTTKKYIELDGAVTNTAGSIGSNQGIQGQWWLQAEALRPAQTKMFPAQTSTYSTTGRLAIAPSGICYFGQNSGTAVDYFYITGMGYWLGE